MKKQSTILALILVTIIVVLALIFSDKKKETTPVTDLIADISSELPTRMCYQYMQPSGIEMESNPPQAIYDIESVSFTLNDTLAEGSHDILPAEKDSNRALFFGASQAGYINAVVTASAEGETWQEQRLYKFDEERLYVGYQEVYTPRVLNDQGVYMYEDVNALVYDTAEFFLSRVDCSGLTY
jgi:hypothetical protein